LFRRAEPAESIAVEIVWRFQALEQIKKLPFGTMAWTEKAPEAGQTNIKVSLLSRWQDRKTLQVLDG